MATEIMRPILIGLILLSLTGCASLILGQTFCHGQWVDCYDDCYCPPLKKK